MAEDGRWWRRDVPIRALGAALLTIGILALRHLFVFGYAGQHPTPGEMGLAAAGFLGCSLGSALAALGARIHEPITIAERWRG